MSKNNLKIKKKYETAYISQKERIIASAYATKEKFRSLKNFYGFPFDKRTIVDVGGGVGGLAIHAALEGAHVAVLDISRVALGLAIKNAQSYGVNTNISAVVADAHALPIKEKSTDIIVLTDVLEHVVKPEIVLAEAHRTLDEGNGLYMIVPNAFGIDGVTVDIADYVIRRLKGTIPSHIKFLTKDRLTTLLTNAGFQLIFIKPFKAAETALLTLMDVFKFPKIIIRLTELLCDLWPTCNSWVIWATKARQ